MEKEDNIEWRLILRKLCDQTTDEDEKLFRSWYEADINNRIYYEKAQHYFRHYYEEGSERCIDTGDAWNTFVAYTHKKTNRFRFRLLKYAAILLLPFFCGWFAYSLIKKSGNDQAVVARQEILPGEAKAILVLGNGEKITLSNKNLKDTLATENNVVINNQNNSLCYNSKGKNNTGSISQNTIITPRGGEYQVTLSDGTRIILNAESQLTYPVEFPGKVRKIQLTGEAYFEVAHNEKAPFIVETPVGKIRVLGTSFNVSAYNDDDVIQTTLVNGSVSFIQPQNNREQILKPGEQITYNKSDQTSEIRQVHTDLYCGWRNGIFVLEDARLEDIMKRISRWYDVEVFFQNEKAKDLIFTGDLEKYEKCEVILNIIELSTNIRFNIRGRTITVCLK